MPRKIFGEWPFNFGCLPEEYSYKEAKVVILPIPYEATTTYKKGCGDAPLAIVQASRFVELYDEELRCEPYKIGIYTKNEMEFSLNNPEKPLKQIKNYLKKPLRDEKFPIIIGGEHTISFGAILAFKEKFPELSVLQLDAHPDLRNLYQETKFSHATVIRRILEHFPVVQVGIRTLSKEEADFYKENPLPCFSAKEVLTNLNLNKIISHLKKDVYITIDMDVFDPSIVPGVGTPEPGGLFWYDVLKILKEVFKKRNVVGVDVVEVSPISGNHISEFTAAKLIYKIIGYKFYLKKESK
jgi:agmatinase